MFLMITGFVDILLAEELLRHDFNFGGKNFAGHLLQHKGPSDFFYLLMGDTQFWFECTSENSQCWAATNHCHSMTSRQCQVQQGNHSNRLQGISLRALIVQMTAKNIRPKGLIINGDLTDYGHRDELDEYKAHWRPQLQGIRVYPGLGNHDYANNVDDCTLNHCANRMLNYFKDYIQTNLSQPLDLKVQRGVLSMTYTGSLAYSWDQCVSLAPTGTLLPRSERQCIHFIQLNNYPTYTRTVKGLFADWKIQSSLEYLRNNLEENKNKPIVINFHAYDQFSANDAFTTDDKNRFNAIIAGHDRFWQFFSLTYIQTLDFTVQVICALMGAQYHWFTLGVCQQTTIF